jgi:Janus/Ocnus family (Ocnus)
LLLSQPAKNSTEQRLLMLRQRIFALSKTFVRSLCSPKMSVDARLEAVPVVEIDEGVFKYILIKVYGKENADGSEPQKLIVR